MHHCIQTLEVILRKLRQDLEIVLVLIGVDLFGSVCLFTHITYKSTYCRSLRQSSITFQSVFDEYHTFSQRNATQTIVRTRIGSELTKKHAIARRYSVVVSNCDLFLWFTCEISSCGQWDTSI